MFIFIIIIIVVIKSLEKCIFQLILSLFLYTRRKRLKIYMLQIMLKFFELFWETTKSKNLYKNTNKLTNIGIRN